MNQKNATYITLSILGLIILFHLGVVLKLIPYDIAWGGNLKTDSEMYVFEAISIFINVSIIGLLLMKGRMIKAVIPLKVINIILWIFFALFVLNTIGNLFAETDFEKYFSIITLAMAILLWIILRKKS